MIEANDFIQEPEKQEVFRLGVVVELFSNKTAKIKFDGEETASQKQYAYLNNYSPVVGDRVVMAALSGTYIILGKLNYNNSPSNSGVFTSLNVSGDTTLGGSLKVTGALGFFGGAPHSRVLVGTLSSLQTFETADSTYSSNEVNMLNHIKTDLENMYEKLNDLIDALSDYKLI